MNVQGGDTQGARSAMTKSGPAGSTWGGTRIFGSDKGGTVAASHAGGLGRKAKRAAAAAASQAGGRGDTRSEAQAQVVTVLPGSFPHEL